MVKLLPNTRTRQAKLSRLFCREALSTSRPLLKLNTLINLRGTLLIPDTSDCHSTSPVPKDVLIQTQRLHHCPTKKHGFLAPPARSLSYSCEPPSPCCGPGLRSWLLSLQACTTWSCRLAGWSRWREKYRGACAFQQGHIHGCRCPEERFRVRRG